LATFSKLAVTLVPIFVMKVNAATETRARFNETESLKGIPNGLGF